MPTDDLTLPASPLQDTTSVVGERYEVGTLLGRGGQGQVHEARDRLTGSVVAIKFLPAERLASARRELAVLRMLDLPGVVRLVDEGTEPRPFLVMERLFPGPVFRPGDPSWLPRLERVLGTLARVHGLGIVHRDIKPSNVMLDRERQPILVDFGIAQHRLAGEAPVSGTPRYMAPEQRDGRSDARSDLYSLGRMVIEGITGVSAPSDPDLGALVAVGVAPRIAEVLCRCAATDPDRRPSGAYAVWRALSDRPPIVLPRRVTRRSVRALFVSRPEDRFIHAADDAAAEIERRARGSSVVEVIDEMLHQGLIGMEGDRLTVDRSAIRQWETVGLVDALGGQGAERRLEQSVRRLWRRGASDAGLALLEAAAPVVGVTARLARLATLQAVTIEQVPALRRARSLVERSDDPASVELLLLLDGYRRWIDRDSAGWVEPLPLPTEELEVERHRLRVRRQYGDVVALDAILTELAPWAAARRTRMARYRAWLGHARYREGRYPEARELYLAAAGDAAPHWRIRALQDAAAGSLESGALDECADLARRTLRLARRAHNGRAECLAILLSRSASYRSGVEVGFDPQLPEAGRPFGQLMVARLALTEAAAAWRTGHPSVVPLARCSAEAFASGGWPAGAALAAALRVAGGGGEATPELVEQILAARPPEVQAQAAALVAHLAPMLAEVGRRALLDCADAPKDLRRAVLSPAECATRLSTGCPESAGSSCTW